MALNKKICEQCRHRKWFSRQYHLEERYEFTFEIMWAKGIVACPWGSGEEDVNKNPPERCPYIAEHLVSQDA